MDETKMDRFIAMRVGIWGGVGNLRVTNGLGPGAPDNIEYTEIGTRYRVNKE